MSSSLLAKKCRVTTWCSIPSPEEQLLLAIIQQANADRSHCRESISKQAKTWMTTGLEPEGRNRDVNHLPHSLHELCDLANLDTGEVRKQLERVRRVAKDAPVLLS